MLKKSITMILLCLSVLLAGCGNAGNLDSDSDIQNMEQQVHFQATVLELLEHSILVEPVDGSQELSSSNQISFGKDSIQDKDSQKVIKSLHVGDVIEIEYDGYIQESYPAGITASKIKLVSTASENDTNQ